MPAPELQEFLAKIQGGDEGSVETMLREMDPFLRRVIHLRLLDGRLRRAVDTTDILQSLLKDFLRRPQARDRHCRRTEIRKGSSTISHLRRIRGERDRHPGVAARRPADAARADGLFGLGDQVGPRRPGHSQNRHRRTDPTTKPSGPGRREKPFK